MVFQWFCYPMTITIEWFFAEWPLTSMVFQCFYQIQVRLLTMVLVMRRRKCNISYFTTNLRNLQNALHAPFHPFHFLSKVLICTQLLEFMTWMKTLPSWVLIRKRPHYAFPVLLPLTICNGFQRHHHHWMEWSEATIENDGFSMVLGQPTIGNDGFSMVGHHWSNDGMVTYHRWSLDWHVLK